MRVGDVLSIRNRRHAPDFELIACSGEDDRSMPEWNAPEHVGVWLNRCYLGENLGRNFGQDLDGKPKPLRKALYERAIDALRLGQPAVAAYKLFFERWRRELCDRPQGLKVIEIEASSRVLLHPSSNASVTDGSLLLHHTYGVPYLPGSGLKGLARAWLRRTTDAAERREGSRSDARDSALVRSLFGYLPRPDEPTKDDVPSQAAVVEFHDALWLPEAPADPDGLKAWKSPLALDIVNPHHTKYYTGDEAPGDTEEPVPTHRLSVAPGTRFLLVLEGATSDAGPWVDYLANDVLVPALDTMGFGAWTSAGYGRFAKPSGSSESPTKAEPPIEWHVVKVDYLPNKRSLAAMMPGLPHKATADEKATQAMLEQLSPSSSAALRDKKWRRLCVGFQANGNGLTIVGLKDPS
jgi:CRISPR type III-B/RAMP module RAMP protein Cmr6